MKSVQEDVNMIEMTGEKQCQTGGRREAVTKEAEKNETKTKIERKGNSDVRTERIFRERERASTEGECDAECPVVSIGVSLEIAAVSIPSHTLLAKAHTCPHTYTHTH